MSVGSSVLVHAGHERFLLLKFALRLSRQGGLERAGRRRKKPARRSPNHCVAILSRRKRNANSQKRFWGGHARISLQSIQDMVTHAITSGLRRTYRGRTCVSAATTQTCRAGTTMVVVGSRSVNAGIPLRTSLLTWASVPAGCRLTVLTTAVTMSLVIAVGLRVNSSC